MVYIKLSIVVSVYNEENVLTVFYDKLIEIVEKININYEIIFVNDGSTDNSLQILKEFVKKNKSVKFINFSKNYGHEAAMIAGIDNALGKVVICMDADMQHPPELIPLMLKIHDKGYDIINMVRTSRKDAGLIKKFSSSLFYKLLNIISDENFEPNASDFFLISKKITSILQNNFRERTRFIRGYIQILGFNRTTINFEAPKRQGGNSKYSILQLFFLSASTIASFSKLPLRLGVIFGLLFAVLGFVIGVYSIIMKFIGNPVSGYTTLIVVMSFMFSVLLVIIGIIGEYIGYLFDEIKKRPIYIIKDKVNFENETE